MDSQWFTIFNFREWVLKSMETIDSLEAAAGAHQVPSEQCGKIVHEAGDIAARFGFVDIYDRSIAVATCQVLPVAARSAYLCTPTEAQRFLAECVKECNRSDAAVIRSAQQSERIAVPSHCAVKATHAERAYGWWIEAQYALGGGYVTDRRAYEWIVPRAKELNEKIPGFQTWSRYVRSIRAKKMEQKNQRRRTLASIIEKLVA